MIIFYIMEFNTFNTNFAKVSPLHVVHMILYSRKVKCSL